MHIVNQVFTQRPAEARSEQETAIFDRMEQLHIPHIRVDHDHADTMEDCLQIEALLGAPVCKNLFLCNRQQTEFYLLLMRGDKPFKTKFLSAQLGCSRLSFADEGHMKELLHTVPGSVSALELLFDTEQKIRLVIDKELLEEAFLAGHPGFSTSTVKLTREDLLRYVESTGHAPTCVELPDPRLTEE